MLEAGTPFPVLAALMGWSPATTVRMAKRYGHIGQNALRRAVESISPKNRMQDSEEKRATERQKSELDSFDNPFDLNDESAPKRAI
jgi:hypothetical protein